MRVADKHFSERIEELERENKALYRKLEHLELAASGANDGLWDWTPNPDTRFVSAPWKTMLGIPVKEHVPPDLWEGLLHPDDRTQAINHFNQFITGNSDNYIQEFRLRHRDGTYRWILSKGRALRDTDNKVIRISGSHTDITEQKMAASAIQKSERKYRNLFQNSLVAMCSTVDDLEIVLEANEKFWSIMGVLRGERHRFRLRDVLQPRHFKDLKRQLRKYKIIENYELKISTSIQSEIWVLLNAVWYEEDQTVDFVFKDITQTKENLLELQKVNFELDSFVYHASHDLRSPLRSILGLIDLHDMEKDEKFRKECIEKIRSSVIRLDDLVVELLSISRNDRVNDPHKPINLIQELNNSIASYYNASDTTKLEITARVLQPVPFISDATRLRIILNNLISNAIKYRSFSKPLSTIHVEMDTDEEKVVIMVKDNGEGIEESKLPNIFDMFYRATERSEGSGLGLYIVKKVADKLDAEINVDSVEMEGTTFTVTIPNTKIK